MIINNEFDMYILFTEIHIFIVHAETLYEIISIIDINF
jgi:hypothetical protein